jgi:hypothetical protein
MKNSLFLLLNAVCLRQVHAISAVEQPLETVSQLQINFCAPSSTPHRLGSVDNASPSLIELFSERGSLYTHTHTHTHTHNSLRPEVSNLEGTYTLFDLSTAYILSWSYFREEKLN